MIHYERWMSLPTIALVIFALAALAIARRTPPPLHANTWLRLGALAGACALCYIGFVYGLTDHRRVQHWPVLSRLFAAAFSFAGILLFWKTITNTPEELWSMLDKTRGDSALLERRAKIDATLQKIDKWRVALAIVGIFVVTGALAMVGHAPKTEPPSTDENIAWLLFFAGLGATVPLLVSLFGTLKAMRDHAKGI